MQTRAFKRGFTVIEVVVVIAVLAILAVLAVPRFVGYTKEASIVRLNHDAKALENASQTYYLKNGDWPRASDTPYTADEAAAFADKVYDNTGKVIALDPSGNYYDLDMQKLSPYIAMQEDPKNFVLQNPVGSIYTLDPLTNIRIVEEPVSVVVTKPVAVITMTPSQNITTATAITWATSSSYDTNSGGTITQTEWTGNQTTYSTPGTYTVTLTVTNDQGVASDPVSVTFEVLSATAAKQISVGGAHALALLNDGTVKAWGYNGQGQLGLGDTINRSSPVTIPGLTGVVQVSAALAPICCGPR